MHTDYYKRPLLLFLIFYVILFVARTISAPAFPVPDIDPYEEIIVTGTSVLNPQTKNGKTNTIIKIKEIDGKKAHGRIYANIPGQNNINFLDTLTLRGKVRRPYSPDIVGNFNWAKYLENKNIFWEFDTEEVKEVKPASFPITTSNNLRAEILKLFKNSFDADSAIILSGIVLGDKAQIPAELHKAFNDSGAMHLLVASGANVGFVCIIIYYLCVFVGVKYNLRLPLALIGAGIYTVLAGADAPLLRAYLMTLCAGIGLKTGRNPGAFHGLIMAALIILLISPKNIFDVGFQMSFLATFIILLSVNTFKIPPAWPKLLKIVLEIFLITTAVQLVLLPIYSNIFYRFSFTALISNIFLVPLSGIIMGLGFLLFLLHLSGIAFLFKLVWGITFICLFSFKVLVTFFSSFSFSAVTMPALSAPAAAIFYISLFFVYNLNIFKHKKIVFAALSLAALLTVLFNPFKEKNYIYLLSAKYKSAVIANIDGKNFLFHDGFDQKLLQNTMLSIGRKKADIEISPVPTTLAKKEIIPFEDVWSGEEFYYKKIKIESDWGINGGANKKWVNIGFSGTENDCLSYRVTYKNIDFTTSCKNNFILLKDQFISNKKNGTVKVNL